MAVVVCVRIKKLFLSGKADKWRKAGLWVVGGLETSCLLCLLATFMWGFFWADNKALTNEESRCQARVSVMYALVTKAPPNEDESQYAPRLPRKHLYVWLHYQTL